MTKKTKISTERDKAMHYFQRARVLQEATDNGYVKCFTCGAVIPVREADGGHGITRADRATELEPDNCWPQCRTCNRFYAGRQYEYMTHLAEVKGQEAVDRLLNMSKARRGDEEAYAALSDEDRAKVYHKKKASEYHEDYIFWKKAYDGLKHKEGK